MRIKVSKLGYYISASAICIMVCTLISGCTVNKVSLLTHQPTGAPIEASEVKLFPRFNDIKEPYRVEGMISAYTLPIINNTAEKRVTLIKETAADLGLNAVIGLQYDIKLGPSGPFDERVGPGRSNAILANIGSARQQNPEDLPKFIVCLPALNFNNIEKGRVEDLLNKYLREHILYSFGYQKGYYVYNRDALRVDRASILTGSISLEALGEPIGILPDFALLCDVEGYDAMFDDDKGKNVIHTLRLTMTLFDLKEKKAVWTGTTEGISSKSVLAKFLHDVRGKRFLTPEKLSAALMKAVDTMPSVKGFRRGPASEY